MRQLLNYLRQFAASAEQNDETCREQRTVEIQALLDEIAVVPSRATEEAQGSE